MIPFIMTYAIHLTEKAFEYFLNLDVACVDFADVAFIQICKNFKWYKQHTPEHPIFAFLYGNHIQGSAYGSRDM